MATPHPVRIIGNYASPYVRKVLVALDVKGVPYEIDPIVPFFGNDEFAKLSPLRRIPVLIDDQVTLCDSSVICQYLEDRYPTPPLFPDSITDRAQARWLEEFADTRMGDVFIWKLFYQRVLGPFIFGKPTDEAVLNTTLNEEIPSVLDYLEPQLPADGFLFGKLGIADISIAVFFRNAAFAMYQTDAARWPKTAAYVQRVLATPSFQKLVPYEEILMRTPPTAQRAALREAGAPLTAESYGTDKPRRGIMGI